MPDVVEVNCETGQAQERPFTQQERQAQDAALADSQAQAARRAARDSIRGKAQAALAANVTYLALANPTNAQVVAQVNRVTRECTALIRLLLDAVESEDGT
jgi:hypothetical protein